jgi:hypothetical protein
VASASRANRYQGRTKSDRSEAGIRAALILDRTVAASARHPLRNLPPQPAPVESGIPNVLGITSQRRSGTWTAVGWSGCCEAGGTDCNKTPAERVSSRRVVRRGNEKSAARIQIIRTLRHGPQRRFQQRLVLHPTRNNAGNRAGLTFPCEQDPMEQIRRATPRRSGFSGLQDRG